MTKTDTKTLKGKKSENPKATRRVRKCVDAFVRVKRSSSSSFAATPLFLLHTSASQLFRLDKGLVAVGTHTLRALPDPVLL